MNAAAQNAVRHSIFVYFKTPPIASAASERKKYTTLGVTTLLVTVLSDYNTIFVLKFFDLGIIHKRSCNV